MPTQWSPDDLRYLLKYETLKKTTPPSPVPSMRGQMMDEPVSGFWGLWINTPTSLAYDITFQVLGVWVPRKASHGGRRLLLSHAEETACGLLQVIHNAQHTLGSPFGWGAQCNIWICSVAAWEMGQPLCVWMFFFTHQSAQDGTTVRRHSQSCEWNKDWVRRFSWIENT